MSAEVFSSRLYWDAVAIQGLGYRPLQRRKEGCQLILKHANRIDSLVVSFMFFITKSSAVLGVLRYTRKLLLYAKHTINPGLPAFILLSTPQSFSPAPALASASHPALPSRPLASASCPRPAL